MRRYFLLTVFVFLAVLVLHSQDLIIHKTDGTSLTIPMQNIDSITFINSPASFECGTSHITDIDGNVYKTVQIDDQCWMGSNLQTTRYRNGEAIALLEDDSSWRSDTLGGMSWLYNDVITKDMYGGYYNWFAVNSAQGICPSGWHVPADEELAQLVDYIVSKGFPNEAPNAQGAANALKSCRQFNSPLGDSCNVQEHPRWNFSSVHNGFDTYGFTGLPSGYRTLNGVFLYEGTKSNWWTSSEFITCNYIGAMYYNYNLQSSHGHIYQNGYEKNYGFNVRCIKN